MADKTNILLIITDQQTHGAMSCAGNDWLHTPGMDRLSERGTRFTRAYCTFPLCSPVRASHMTGRYPHEVDTPNNLGKHFWAHDIPRESLMGHIFSQAGYRCVWAGKDNPPADGSRDFEVLCSHGDVKVGDRMTEFLQDPGDKPWLASVNFVNPHNICEFARGATLFEGGVGPEPKTEEMPPLPANHAVPPYEPEIIREMQQRGVENHLPRNYTPDHWRRYIWAYYRMVELVDRQVARIVDALDKSGQADNTLVWFMGDHGDGCAAHQWNQKRVFYEEVIRVPTILAGPGVTSGAVNDRLVSTGLDVLPTCCAAAGIPLPADDLEGRSLLELADGEPAQPWRDAVFVESCADPESGGNSEADKRRVGKRNMGRAIVTERWKYSAWKWGHNREQLIDLANDPGEMQNLAVVARHRDTLAEMRRRLHEWTQRTSDPFMVPGYEILSPGSPR
ncbi:MAG: sulfatase [Planctomycetota bacterium]